jgi:hypothetical protein
MEREEFGAWLGHQRETRCWSRPEMARLTKDDLIEQVQGIITVGEFYAMAAGGQIIFT